MTRYVGCALGKTKGKISSPKHLRLHSLASRQGLWCPEPPLHRAQFTTGLQQFFSAGMGAIAITSAPSHGVNAPKKLHQMSPAEGPKPSERSLSGKQQHIRVHPGNGTAAAPSFKSHIVPSTSKITFQC